MKQINTTNKLQRLEFLRDTLTDLSQQSVKDSDEWQIYRDMLENVREAISDELRRQGSMGVYPIRDGSAQELLFEGTPEQCEIYTENLLKKHPEMVGNIIVIGF